jgi:hypothetical protein
MLDERFAAIWNDLLGEAVLVLGMLGLIIYSFPYLGLLFIPFMLAVVSQRNVLYDAADHPVSYDMLLSQNVKRGQKD